MDLKELEEAGLTPGQIETVLRLSRQERQTDQERITQAEGALENQKKRAAVLREIRKYSPRDAEIACDLVDMSRIQMDENGNPEGLEEQMEALRARGGFLFFQPSDQGGIFAPQGAPVTLNPFDMNEFLRR